MNQMTVYWQLDPGGNFALSAGRALKRYSPDQSAPDIARAALEIAGEICVFTNDQIVLEVLE